MDLVFFRFVLLKIMIIVLSAFSVLIKCEFQAPSYQIFWNIDVDLGDSSLICPFGSEFSRATEIHYYLQSRKG